MKKRKIHESWPVSLYVLAFCLRASLGQNSDCTGVDCPLLDNCIEEVLEDGDCCASCAQRGCPCEGYQYYDCISTGFKSGKVPEGASYLVDSGSTECTCPAGGGRISCRFIPCPEVPPNCIDLSETDACPHCLRLGCVQGNLKYEAGHSFHMEPCQVCHCPNDGGDLMCSPIPDCSSETLTSTEQNELHLTRHEGHKDFQSRPDKIPANHLPLYTENSSEIDDYDYFPETTISPGVTAQPPLLTQLKTEAHDHYEDTREELKENESVQETTDVQVVTAGARPELTPTENRVQQLTTSKPSQESLKNESGKPDDLENPQHRVPELSTVPKMQISPTTTAPAIRKDAQSKPLILKRHQDRRDSKSEDYSVFSPQMMDSCCLDGERWASDHGHCNSMELSRTESGSTCRSVQRQCCLSSWRDSRCSAGLNAARQGHDCGSEDEEAESCNSYRECCSCCALGLRMRARREACDAPQGLGETCAHIVLSCCEGTDRSNRSAVTERGRPQATSPPRKVPEGTDRQPFSLGELEDSENMVEEIKERQDVDECRLYQGQLCDQRCVNTPGSYLCECFPNYVLHQDGIHCLSVTTEEENRLKDKEVPAEDPNPSETISTPSDELLNPCEGNGPCAQRCSPVDGRPQCSCFPGFSLMADGRSCEDVDECLLSTHTCQPDEKCTNTDGHFTCQRAVVCPTGYREKNELCEDINECIMGTHDCTPGFNCINTAGSFSCRSRVRCPGGFSYDAQGQCADIDECTTITQPCSPGFNCINTYGSYTCQRKIIMCGRGYHASPDGSRCLDINECDTGVHRCGEDQLCQNLPGSYRCDCRPGYQYDMFRRLCLDVNECWRYVGRLCAQTCENTPGSYQCSCSSGYTLSSDGKNCEDLNECSSSPCSQECTNIYGSYQCYCRTGFYLGEDTHTCKDVDECSQSVGNLCAYKCVNVPGSYECACPEYGYTMAPNGRSCRDVDECAIGSHNCTVDETCYNIQGGFRCLSFMCPTNYRRVSDTRCERVSCSNFLECQNIPARITYYQLSFQINIIVPALIFRMGPSPAYTGDNIVIRIADGNQDAYFSPRKLTAYTGAIYLQRQLPQPHDFLLDVEMKLWRQGAVTTFLARIYVFVTANLA